MEHISNHDDVYYISDRLNIPQVKVKRILDAYIAYIRRKVSEGESVPFLRICDIVVKDYDGVTSTFGYVCGEVSLATGFKSDLVRNILLYYEDCITRDLKNLRVHAVWGLFSFKMKESLNGKVVVGVHRSVSLNKVGNGVNFFIQMRRSFKRKVEFYDR